MAGTLGTANPFRYRSYYYDNETGYYYLQSRYYDSNMGRFINADDVSKIDGTSMFGYCKNNPVMMIDPTGEFNEMDYGITTALNIFFTLIITIYFWPVALVSNLLFCWIAYNFKRYNLIDFFESLGVHYKLITYKWYDYRIATLRIDLDNDAVQVFSACGNSIDDFEALTVSGITFILSKLAIDSGIIGELVGIYEADCRMLNLFNKGRGVSLNYVILKKYPFILSYIWSR